MEDRKGTPGKPLYKRGDIVDFIFTNGKGGRFELTGKVAVVDAYGTFSNIEQPYYDIFAPSIYSDKDDSGDVLYKHVPETDVSLPKGE